MASWLTVLVSGYAWSRTLRLGLPLFEFTLAFAVRDWRIGGQTVRQFALAVKCAACLDAFAMGAIAALC